MIRAYFDGAYNQLTNQASYGVIIYEHDQKVWEFTGFVPNEADVQSSCNVAEYAALIAILDRLAQCHKQHDDITIFGDSRLVINQMWADQRGRKWRIKRGMYADLAHAAAQQLAAFTNCKGQWIAREQNAAADEISRT
jgi:ribonuclease HI